MNSKNKTNPLKNRGLSFEVVLYPKDTEKWKQFTTSVSYLCNETLLFCIPKILKNESNSQPLLRNRAKGLRCFVSQRYWKMKAIHNPKRDCKVYLRVVLYPKDTEKWKQFTTKRQKSLKKEPLFCIPKILKNESNSQLENLIKEKRKSCFVSQRYWKMKAIHNNLTDWKFGAKVVLYPKDTEKWKQFTTKHYAGAIKARLFCIPKILKNESNSQLISSAYSAFTCCFVSQRYWKMKAIHNIKILFEEFHYVVLYPKDTEKWKQFTTSTLFIY